ncbi:MAG: glycerophosphodiester phosphodiesterase [Caldisericia bacterium]
MKIIGHRGCFYETENTIKSFLKAFELGADGIEIDIQSTLDKFLVVSHDSNLKRLTGIDFDINKKNYSELFKMRVKKEKIPLLLEVLELAKEKNKSVDIEVKNPNDFYSVCELVSKFNYEETIISSFFHKELYNNKKNFYKIRFAYLYSHEPKNIYDYLNEVDFLKPNINYLTEDYKKFSERVIPWIVNEVKDFKYIKEFNLWGVITDFPEKLKNFLDNKETQENIFINFLMKSIIKEESNINKDFLKLNLRNIFSNIVINEIKINDKMIFLDRNFPIFWNINDKITIKLQKFSLEDKITFNIKDFGIFEIEIKELIKNLS